MIPILASTNASPIQITTVIPHGFTTGNQVIISGHGVNDAANNVFGAMWTITVIDSLNFTLNSSVGNGVGGKTGYAGLPIDLTGYTPLCELRDAPAAQNGYLIATVTSSIPTPTNGIITLSLPNSVTANPVDGNGCALDECLYDLWLLGLYQAKVMEGKIRFTNSLSSLSD